MQRPDLISLKSFLIFKLKNTFSKFQARRVQVRRFQGTQRLGLSQLLLLRIDSVPCVNFTRIKLINSHWWLQKVQKNPPRLTSKIHREHPTLQQFPNTPIKKRLHEHPPLPILFQKHGPFDLHSQFTQKINHLTLGHNFGNRTNNACRWQGNATLDATDTHLAANWTSFISGTLTIAAGSCNLSALTDIAGSSLYVSAGSYNLSGLTDIDDSSLYVTNGATLSLPDAVSYDANGTFQAEGAGSVLDLAALTTQTQANYFSQWNVDAADSGEIEIARLTSVNTGPYGSIQIEADAASKILNDLTNLNGTNITIDGANLQNSENPSGSASFSIGQNSSVVLEDEAYNGSISMNVGQGASVALEGGTYGDGATFNVGQGASVDLTGGQTTTYSGTLTGAGAGAVMLSSGECDSAGNLKLDFPGSMFQWSGGSFAGNLSNLGTINLGGSSDKSFAAQSNFYNYGDIIQTGAGNLALGDGMTLVNETVASYVIDSDSGFDNDGNAQQPPQVENLGYLASSRRGHLGPVDRWLSVQHGHNRSRFRHAANRRQQHQPGGGKCPDRGHVERPQRRSLSLPGGTNITSNAATIDLDGSGAAIGGLTGLSANSGSFSLTDGADFTTTGNFTNAGSLTVGGGSVLSIQGNYTQTGAATLTDQFSNAYSVVPSGEVAVQDVANLSGAFSASLVDGFAPNRNAISAAMTFGSLSGSFTSVEGLNPYFTEIVNPESLDLVTGTGDPVTLELSQVSAPTAATTGQQITVNWQVSNTSSNSTVNSWQDSVYFSTTAAITSRSVLLGSVTHSGGLDSGGFYNASLTARARPDPRQLLHTRRDGQPGRNPRHEPG